MNGLEEIVRAEEYSLSVESLAFEEDSPEQGPLGLRGRTAVTTWMVLTTRDAASGTARLEEAVVAFRAALEVITYERMGVGWATTQANLGKALHTLGQRRNRSGSQSGPRRTKVPAAAQQAEELTPPGDQI